MAELFTGRITRAVLNKTVYEPDENIQIRVEGVTSFERDFVVSWQLYWLTAWAVFDEYGRVVFEDDRKHLVPLVGMRDDVIDDFTINLKGVKYSQNFRIRLQGQMSAGPQYIDEKWITVAVAGSGAEPSPTPPYVPGLPQPVIPVPTPKPAPQPGLPGFPKLPGLPAGYESLILGGLVITAVVLLSGGQDKPKGKKR